MFIAFGALNSMRFEEMRANRLDAESSAQDCLLAELTNGGQTTRMGRNRYRHRQIDAAFTCSRSILQTALRRSSL